MDLDELKALWSEDQRQLAASMRLNTQLLQHANLDKASSSLKQLERGITAEATMNFIALLLLGSFTGDHAGRPQFLIPAIAMEMYVVALLAADVRQIVQIRSIDFDEPVVAISRRLEGLRVLRIRTTLGTLLFAPLMWLPLLIVAARGLLGVDIYSAVSPAWLAANIVFGLALIPIALVAARTRGSRIARFGPLRALADDVAGRSLRAAHDALDSIRRFEEAA
ncbi:MAG: hypothetical protein ACREM2_03260 [Vulcanimicrobiaceae bacterium]